MSGSSSSHSNTSMYSIDKLTGDNFSSWKFRLQLILMDRGLWEIVDGSEVSPTPTGGSKLDGNSGDGASSVVAGGSGNGNVQLEWKKRDNQALAQIALTVSNSELIHIRNAKSSHDAWKKICSVYEAKGLAAKVYLRRRFFNVKYIDNGNSNLQSHINLIRDLADQLEAISAGVSDEDMAMTLLCSLPDSYDYLIVALESRNSEDLSFDFVSARLLSEEKRKGESMNVSINANIVGNIGHNVGIKHNMNDNHSNVNASNSENIALYTNSYGNGNNTNVKNHSKSFRPMIKCSYCNKKNHTEDKCYAKHGFPVGHPKHNNSDNANIASVSVNNATLHAFVVGENVQNTQVCDWLIDSGASMHLCNNRSYFDNNTFKHIPHKKNVMLGNNECIEAIGMGDIPVRVLINNNNNTPKLIDVTFKDVLYVPKIAANLLSVAKMTNNDVKVMFTGNECNIINSVGECIGNAYKQHNSNLYRISVQPLYAMYAGSITNNGNNVNTRD
jgi:cell division cycle protein 20 (cofactor of APC complex)/ATP-binding cassette subfamily B (MDR/TAP) protein 1